MLVVDRERGPERLDRGLRLPGDREVDPEVQPRVGDPRVVRAERLGAERERAALHRLGLVELAEIAERVAEVVQHRGERERLADRGLVDRERPAQQRDRPLRVALELDRPRETRERGRDVGVTLSEHPLPGRDHPLVARDAPGEVGEPLLGGAEPAQRSERLDPVGVGLLDERERRREPFLRELGLVRVERELPSDVEAVDLDPRPRGPEPLHLRLGLPERRERLVLPRALAADEGEPEPGLGGAGVVSGLFVGPGRAQEALLGTRDVTALEREHRLVAVEVPEGHRRVHRAELRARRGDRLEPRGVAPGREERLGPRELGVRPSERAGLFRREDRRGDRGELRHVRAAVERPERLGCGERGLRALRVRAREDVDEGRELLAASIQADHPHRHHRLGLLAAHAGRLARLPAHPRPPVRVAVEDGEGGLSELGRERLAEPRERLLELGASSPVPDAGELRLGARAQLRGAAVLELHREHPEQDARRREPPEADLPPAPGRIRLERGEQLGERGKPRRRISREPADQGAANPERNARVLRAAPHLAREDRPREVCDRLAREWPLAVERLVQRDAEARTGRCARRPAAPANCSGAM